MIEKMFQMGASYCSRYTSTISGVLVPNSFIRLLEVLTIGDRGDLNPCCQISTGGPQETAASPDHAHSVIR